MRPGWVLIKGTGGDLKAESTGGKATKVQDEEEGHLAGRQAQKAS
jgi:hypothetical protein